VGKALLERMLSYAAAHQISRIVLEVRVSNAPAIALYTQYGFACVGIRQGFYELPKEDAAIMIKE
jgi:ribosomal-protein-alanine N-acetyltransferase